MSDRSAGAKLRTFDEAHARELEIHRLLLKAGRASSLYQPNYAPVQVFEAGLALGVVDAIELAEARSLYDWRWDYTGT